MKKRLKGSVVIEASILTDFLILVSVLIILGMVLEYLNSIQVVDYLAKQDTINGFGEDDRVSGAIGLWSENTAIWTETLQGRDKDAYSYRIEISEMVSDTRIIMSNFRLSNWFIGRERLRSMYRR